MDKSNINDIVKSELVARTNNARLRQEYGEYSVHSNVGTVDGHLEFKTTYKIISVLYVTINGVTQTINRDYSVIGDRIIRFETAVGDRYTNPLVLVGYQYDKLYDLGNVRPTITQFYITPSSGQNGRIDFVFEIEKSAGLNIYWSILRDGDADPLYSGDALSSAGLDLHDDITEHDLLSRAGEKVPYTLVVVYDMPIGNALVMDEKLMASASYSIDELTMITGSVDISPSGTSIAESGTYQVTALLMVPQGSVPVFNWKLTSHINGNTVVIANNNQTNIIIPPEVVNYTSSPGQYESDVYTLWVQDMAMGDWRQLGTDRFSINVPSIQVYGRGGFMPASIYNLGGVPIGADAALYLSRREDNMFKNTDPISKQNIDNVEPLSIMPNFDDYPLEGIYMIIELPISLSGNIDGIFKFYNNKVLMESYTYAKLDIAVDTVAYIFSAVYSPFNYPPIEIGRG